MAAKLIGKNFITIKGFLATRLKQLRVIRGSVNCERMWYDLHGNPILELKYMKQFIESPSGVLRKTPQPSEG